VHEPHSIDRHPLRAMLTADEFARLRDDVQFCRVSWPVCIVVDRPLFDPKPTQRAMFEEKE
jgi:hypothetical protein